MTRMDGLVDTRQHNTTQSTPIPQSRADRPRTEDEVAAGVGEDEVRGGLDVLHEASLVLGHAEEVGGLLHLLERHACGFWGFVLCTQMGVYVRRHVSLGLFIHPSTSCTHHTTPITPPPEQARTADGVLEVAELGLRLGHEGLLPHVVPPLVLVQVDVPGLRAALPQLLRRPVVRLGSWWMGE